MTSSRLVKYLCKERLLNTCGNNKCDGIVRIRYYDDSGLKAKQPYGNPFAEQCWAMNCSNKKWLWI